MVHRTLLSGLAIAALAWTAPAAAQQQAPATDTTGNLIETRTAGLEWAPITPPGFEPGTEIAVVRGDPTAAGEPYVIRLRFPDGYRFPPHWHPVPENVTVLEGTFLLAMGEQADESGLRRYQQGDFLFMHPRNPHFGGAEGQTVIQLHGAGPFEIVTVGTPEDARRTGR